MQSVGTYTYHFGPGGDIWQTWDETETGARAFALPPVADADSRAEIARSGIESEQPVTLVLRPIATSHARDRSGLVLAPGDYRLRLYFAPQAGEVAVQGDETSPLERQRVESETPAAPAPSWQEEIFTVKVGASGLVRLTITPIAGKAVLHGAVLAPVAVADGPR